MLTGSSFTRQGYIKFWRHCIGSPGTQENFLNSHILFFFLEKTVLIRRMKHKWEKNPNFCLSKKQIKTSFILSHLDQNGYHQESKLGHLQPSQAVLLRWGLASHWPAWALKGVAGGKTFTGPLCTVWCQAGGPHHDEQIYSKEMGEKEEQNSPCAVDKAEREK